MKGLRKWIILAMISGSIALLGAGCQEEKAADSAVKEHPASEKMGDSSMPKDHPAH